MSSASKRWPWIALAALGLAVILRVTLVPTQDPDTGIFHLCLLCGELGLSDAIGNVALFMPVAAGLYLAGLPGRRTVVALLTLSTTIELVQLFVPGRESALGDIVSNTLGAAAGVGLAYWLPRRRRTARAGFAAAVAALLLIAAIAFAFRPAFPARIYYGQWTPELGQYELYRGRVLNAEIGGRALHSWRVPDSKAVRRLLLAGDTLRVTALAGPPPDAVAPIFNIYDDWRREIVLLGADRQDLVAHLRLVASDLRLRQPDLRWSGALAGAQVGDTLRLGLRRVSRGWCLALDREERCDFGLTVGQGWSLIQSPARAGPTARGALNAIFTLAIGLGVGLVVGRTAAGYLAAGILVAGALLVPSLLGLAFTPLGQLGGLLAGLVGGTLIP